MTLSMAYEIAKTKSVATGNKYMILFYHPTESYRVRKYGHYTIDEELVAIIKE